MDDDAIRTSDTTDPLNDKTMTEDQALTTVDRLRARTAEAEWYEFKRNRVPPPEEFGQYLARGLDPRLNVEAQAVAHPDGRVVVVEVSATRQQPASFLGKKKIRVGTSLTNLSEHPEKARALWNLQTDWSAEVVDGATLDDLDPDVIAKARREFAKKNPHQTEEIEEWDDETFLNKARVIIRGKITHTALVLLGRPESASLLSPAVAKISWILKDADNQEVDYKHFAPPFILQVDRLLNKIRNLTLRDLPSGTLFPNEVQQYEPWVIREALHNAIAHQDYGLRGRITVVETPDNLRITNLGSFLPESVEHVIQQDAPQAMYRNTFLAEAMVNLNMIDTQGGGIKRMYRTQRERFFPLPDYDLSDRERVVVNIPGKILDEQYTQLLAERTDLDLWQVLMLDKVQKGQQIPHEAYKRLRKQGIVEGRYPNTILSSSVAQATGQEAHHIRQRGLSNDYYRQLILELLQEHAPVSRSEVDALLMDKLPESLSEKQKKDKVHNLLNSLRRKDAIENRGSRGQPEWVLKT